MLFQKPEKAQPFLAVFFVHRVAPGGVEQDAFAGEEPVAIARAADALNDGIAAVGEWKLQSRFDDGRGLARCRVANDHVPRQFVQRRAATQLPQFAFLDGLHGVEQTHAQSPNFGFFFAAGFG